MLSILEHVVTIDDVTIATTQAVRLTNRLGTIVT